MPLHYSNTTTATIYKYLTKENILRVGILSASLTAAAEEVMPTVTVSCVE